METIDKALEGITGYLSSIKRNPARGWYELEIGIPDKWVFDDNDEIECEILAESKNGKFIRIAPKADGVIVDSLITFVKIIILTNIRIAEKEQEFESKLQEMKDSLVAEAKRYYQELDELKENSFAVANESFTKSLHPESEKPENPVNPVKTKRVYNRKPTTTHS